MAALAGLRYHADQHIVIFHPLVLAGTSPLVHQTDLAGRNADIEINIIAAATVAAKGQVSFSNP